MARTIKIIRTITGFTLVELMVVVAIIGILAAIAIPNFKTYQAKARQTEARLGLSNVFTAESAFSVENSTFSSCIAGIGYGSDSSKRFYTVGFSDAAATAGFCGSDTKQQCNSINYAVVPAVGLCPANTNPPPASGCPAAGCAAGASAPFLTHFPASQTANGVAVPGQAALAAPQASVVKTAIFTAVAAGFVSTGAGAVNDIWTIDQNKALQNSNPSL